MRSNFRERSIADVGMVVKPGTHRGSERRVVEQTSCTGMQADERPSGRQPLLERCLSIIREDLFAVGEEDDRLERRELLLGEKGFVLAERRREEVRVVCDALNGVDGGGNGGVAVSERLGGAEMVKIGTRERRKRVRHERTLQKEGSARRRGRLGDIRTCYRRESAEEIERTPVPPARRGGGRRGALTRWGMAGEAGGS